MTLGYIPQVPAAAAIAMGSQTSPSPLVKDPFCDLGLFPVVLQPSLSSDIITTSFLESLR